MRAAMVMALGLLVSGVPGLAGAQTAVDPTHAEESDAVVSFVVAEAVGTALNADQTKIIKSVAYQQSVSTVCPGFEVDEARQSAEMMRIAPGGERTPEESQTLTNAVIFAMGAYVGSQLAIAMQDEAAFCAHAEAEREDPAAAHLIWVAKP